MSVTFELYRVFESACRRRALRSTGLGVLGLLLICSCRPQRPDAKGEKAKIKAAGGVSQAENAAPKGNAQVDPPAAGVSPDAGKGAAAQDRAKKGEISLSAKQAQKIRGCDDLIAQICQDLGASHLGCSLSREKLPQVGDKECQGLVPRYSALIADLQKRAAVKKDATREQMAKMSAPQKAPGFGSADAPIQIVEFLDFECMACARLSSTILDLRKKSLPGGPLSNKVAYTARMFPLEQLHPQAKLAAKAALAAHEQGRYWEYHDALFEGNSVATQLDRGALVQTAKDLGLDVKGFSATLDGAKMDAHLEEDLTLGDDVTVLATPTIFINGKRVAGFEFQAHLEQELSALRALAK